MKFKIPFLHNVRRGLATNSSSSHSLVYFDTERPNHDDVAGTHIDPEFGWNVFKLRTKGEKLMYALTAVLAREGLNVGWHRDGESNQKAFDALKRRFPQLDDEFFETASRGYIDHQSQSDPKALIKAALDPKVEIWGGNDNGDDPHEDYTEYDKAWNKKVNKAKAPDGIIDVEYL